MPRRRGSENWAILAGASLTLSHRHRHGARGSIVRYSEREGARWLVHWSLADAQRADRRFARLFGLSILTGVFFYWSAHGLAPIANVFPAVAGTCAVAIGMQNVLGGFLLAIVSGNEAEFLQSRRDASTSRATEPTAETAGSRMPDLRVVNSPAIAPTSQAEPASRAKSLRRAGA